LAKNIVEHSADEPNEGKGMITLRAYQPEEGVKDRDLETHVFDYGRVGIIPKLVADTKKKAAMSEMKQSLRDCYHIDAEYFNNRNEEYKLDNFINPLGRESMLEQQKYRHTSHYGINKLYKLLDKLDGSMVVRSIGSDGTTDPFNNEEDAPQMLELGTHYFLRVHFNLKKFDVIEPRQFDIGGQRSIIDSLSLNKFSQQYAIAKTIRISELKELSETLDKQLLIIDDLEEAQGIGKDNVDSIYNSLDSLSALESVNMVAINVHDKIKDTSVLLRFLSYLTTEYKQTFIVYGVDYEAYVAMLKDNHEFVESRRTENDPEDYWSREREILLFVCPEDHAFYFADILSGRTKEEFVSLNHKVHQTFPNIIAIDPTYANKEDIWNS
jgi:hypothetical protein